MFSILSWIKPGGHDPKPRDSKAARGSQSEINAEKPQSRTGTNRGRGSTKEMDYPERQRPQKDHAMIVNIEDLEPEDVVIAIMGPTGSGKSTFVDSATGRKTQGVGHSLKSFTSEVLAVKFVDEESGRRVVLVDTPGFDDTYKSDLDILNMISEWLNSSYDKHKLLSGILYLHRITDNRMAGTPLKNLRIFQKLCGKDALEKVYLTTTMWDEVDQEVGEKRLEELCAEYWKPMIDLGAQVARCRSDDDSSKELIRRILAKEDDRRALQVQYEMGELKKEVKETAAGQQLYSQLETLVQEQSVLLAKISKVKKGASDPDTLARLQKDYDNARAQVDEKLRQMQELKLSRFKHLRRVLSRIRG